MKSQFPDHESHDWLRMSDQRETFGSTYPAFVLVGIHRRARAHTCIPIRWSIIGWSIGDIGRFCLRVGFFDIICQWRRKGGCQKSRMTEKLCACVHRFFFSVPSFPELTVETKSDFPTSWALALLPLTERCSSFTIRPIRALDELNAS